MMTIKSTVDHSKEEVIAVYHWREFGGPADKLKRLLARLGIKSARSYFEDISVNPDGSINVSASFTLDDGSTTLIKN